MQRGSAAFAVAANHPQYRPGQPAWSLLAPTLVLLAGLGYGWVLQLSGRLTAAVLLHFLLLSYPLRLN